MAQTTVNYNLKDAGYANFANQTITFTLKDVGTHGDNVFARGSVSSLSDANGAGSLTVFRTAASNTNTTYDITLPGGEHAEVIIPDGVSSIQLSTLLSVHQVDATPATSSVLSTAVNRANHTGDLTLDSLPGGAITGTLAVANGGTNASSASAARTSLGAQEQKDVLDDLGALSAPASDGQFIVATGAGAFQYETAATARTSLGLGTIATQASNSVDIDGGAIDGVTIGTNSVATDVRVDNLKLDGNAITSTDTDGNIDLTPDGTGEVNISKVDIDGGAIDGTTIGGSTAAAVTGTDVLATDSIGYGAGNGGTVTQTTSKSTGVTLNAVSGEITMHNAQLNHDTNVQFTLTNNKIAATDVVLVNIKDCVGASSEYIATITAVGSGSCEIMLRNISNDNNNKSEAVVLSFAVIKAVTS